MIDDGDCNLHRLDGSFENRENSRNHFDFNANGSVGKHNRRCSDGNYNKRLYVQSQSKMIRYNSKLPIVIYTPKGYSIKYSFWSKEDKQLLAIPA
jgi:ecotin